MLAALRGATVGRRMLSHVVVPRVGRMQARGVRTVRMLSASAPDVAHTPTRHAGRMQNPRVSCTVSSAARGVPSVREPVAAALDRLRAAEARYEAAPVTATQPDVVKFGTLELERCDGSTSTLPWQMILDVKNSGGAYKGELRFSEEPMAAQLEDARRITDKANLVGIRFGGAVANVTVDPATLTLAERRRLVQVFVVAIHEWIGSTAFIPAPGLGVGVPDAADIIEDTMKGIHGSPASAGAGGNAGAGAAVHRAATKAPTQAYCTGKPGFAPRLEATGASAFACIQHMLRYMPNLASRNGGQLRVCVDGLGKSTLPLITRLLHANGSDGQPTFVVAAVSDSTCAMTLPPTLSKADATARIAKVVAAKRSGTSLAAVCWAEGWEVSPDSSDALLSVPCDVMVLGSVMDRVHEGNVETLGVGDGGMLVSVANNAVTDAAASTLAASKPALVQVPELLASVGGLLGSACEVEHDLGLATGTLFTPPPSFAPSTDELTVEAFNTMLDQVVGATIDRVVARATEKSLDTSPAEAIAGTALRKAAATAAAEALNPVARPPKGLTIHHVTSADQLQALPDAETVAVFEVRPIVANRFGDIMRHMPGIEEFLPNRPPANDAEYDDYEVMLSHFGRVGAHVLARLLHTHAPDALDVLHVAERRLKGRRPVPGSPTPAKPLPHLVLRGLQTGIPTPSVVRGLCHDYPGRAPDAYKDMDHMEELSMLALVRLMGFRHGFSRFEKGGIAIQKNVPVEATTGMSVGSDPLGVHIHTEDVHEWPHYTTFFLKGVLGNPARTNLLPASQLETLVRRDPSLSPEQAEAVWTGLHDFVKLTQGAGISLDAAQQRCLISPPIQAMKFRGDFGPDGTPLVKVNGATYPLGQRETGEPVYRVQPLRDEHYRAHGVASDEATDRQRNAKAAVEWQRSAMSSSGWVIDCPEGSGLSIHRGDVHVLNNFVNAHGRTTVAPGTTRQVERLYVDSSLKQLWAPSLNFSSPQERRTYLRCYVAVRCTKEQQEYMAAVLGDDVVTSTIGFFVDGPLDGLAASSCSDVVEQFASLRWALGRLHDAMHRLEYLHHKPSLPLSTEANHDAINGLVSSLEALFASVMTWVDILSPQGDGETGLLLVSATRAADEACSVLATLDITSFTQGDVDERLTRLQGLLADTDHVTNATVAARRAQRALDAAHSALH